MNRERYFRLTKEGVEYLKSKKLSAREIEVVEKMIVHRTGQEVADSLFICLKSVKFHLTSVYRKLGIKSYKDIILYLYEYINCHYLENRIEKIIGPKRIIFPNPLPTGNMNEH